MFKTFFCLSLLACAPYSIVKQAGSNPLRDAAGKLKLEAIDFSQVKVNGLAEADALARNAADSEFRAYDTDKRKLDANFRLEVSKRIPKLIGGGDDGYRLVVHAVDLNPGKDLSLEKPEAGLAGSTRATFVVDLCDVKMTVLDRISIEVGMAQTAAEPQASQRLRALGSRLGESVAEYLKTRAGS